MGNKVLDIKEGDIVIFYCDPYKEGRSRDFLLDGHVLYIDENRRKVSISYLYGYKSLVDDVPFEDVFYVVDQENGEYLTLKGYQGWFRKLN